MTIDKGGMASYKYLKRNMALTKGNMALIMGNMAERVNTLGWTSDSPAFK